MWNEVYLAPAPPMYRPFVAMEEAENDKKSSSRGKPAINKGGRIKFFIACYRSQLVLLFMLEIVILYPSIHI